MKKQLLIFVLFAVLAISLRVFSFFPNVINHDESTYIVIADALLKGKTYFVDYVDTKPIGIFLLYAGFLSLLGKTIFGLRLIAALWLALTAFLLYRIQLDWGRRERVGIASGVIYLFLNSIYTYYGVSPNTETFFNLFTVLCLWLILGRRGGWEYLLAGLCLGLGLLIKYVVVFDGLAFGLFLLLEQYRSKRDWRKFIGKALLLTTGLVFPIGLVFLHYHRIGEMETFLFHTFVLPGRYPEVSVPVDYFKFLMDFFLRFFPVTLLYFLGFFSRTTDADLRLLGLLWSGGVLAAVLLPGKFFGHYFIHFMLPFSFIAAQAFSQLPKRQPPWLRWAFMPRIAYSLLGLVFGYNLMFQKMDYYDKTDDTQVVADYLSPKLGAEDRIYTGNYAQILYFLLDRPSPIKYVHPSLFWETKHMEALGLVVKKEVEKIKEAAPRFILVRDSLGDDRLEAFLKNDYRLAKIFFEKNVRVYERNK
jgi:4-amino-4-deoxy-L-arabinose transferase-like glycosyltransferase